MRKLAILVLGLGVSIAWMGGCGGAGNSGGQSNDPEGVFAIEFNPILTDGTIEDIRLDLELDVDTNGNIESGYARLLSDNDVVVTTDVTGTATAGDIECTVAVEFFGEIHIDAIHNGINWVGTYEFAQKTSVLENGTIDIERRNPGIVSMAGEWSGTFVITEGPNVGGPFPWSFEFVQKGYETNFQGSVNGAAHSGLGTIVGNYFEMRSVPDVEVVATRWQGSVSGDSLTGTFIDPKGNKGTFQATR